MPTLDIIERIFTALIKYKNNPISCPKRLYRLRPKLFLSSSVPDFGHDFFIGIFVQVQLADVVESNPCMLFVAVKLVFVVADH